MTEFDVFTLENGIKCVHKYVNQPVAHIALTIGAGTRDECVEQHGVAHLVEHLMFKGTRRRSAYHVNNLLENAGGELNAYTSKEETVIHATLLRSEVAKGVDLLSDMAFNSTFLPRDLAKEREVIIDEINSYKDSPSELIFDDFEEMLFANSALGRNILGNKRNLMRATQKQLIDYTSMNYSTDRIVFSCASRMTHKRFRQICDQYLGVIASNIKISNRTAPSRLNNFDLQKSKNTYQTHCVLGGYAYNLNDLKRLQLAFLTNILGGPLASSRLNAELREKYALTYNVEAGYVPYSDSGLFTIYFGCDKEKIERSIELTKRELNKMMNSKLTSLQLSRYKKQFIGQLTIASESTESLMLSIAKSVLTYGTFDGNSAIQEKINAITADELLDVANETFTDSNISMLIYK